MSWNRIRRSDLQTKVDYINKKLGKQYAIDSYSPGGNPYIYKLVYPANEYGAIHEVTNDRMTIREFYAYLRGMVEAIDPS